MLKISESAAEVTIGDDADAADDVDYTYPIPNEESGRLTGCQNSQIPVASYGTILVSIHSDKFGSSSWFNHPNRGADRATRKSCINSEISERQASRNSSLTYHKSISNTKQERWLSPTERASVSAISRRHILASHGYAPGTIAVNVTWMERGFNAGQMHVSIYPSIFNCL